METVITYIDESPGKAIVYILMVAILGLCGVILALWRDKNKNEKKNFNMLVRSIENLKDYATAINNLTDIIKAKE